MSEELKRCPFCGVKIVAPVIDDDVRCSYCGARVSFGRWQKRPIEDALNGRIAKLTVLVERLSTLVIGQQQEWLFQAHIHLQATFGNSQKNTVASLNYLRKAGRSVTNEPTVITG